MSTPPPLQFTWDGEAMVPVYPKLADRHYVIGQRYFLEEHREASSASRGHYFAVLKDAFASLPEHLAAQFPNVGAMRKRALIEADFYTQEVIDAGSNIVAVRIAAYARQVDDYAVISVSDNIVIIRRAQSQSAKEMGHEAFQKSKSAVLELVAEWIGVEPEQLSAANQGAGGVRSPARAA